VVWEGISREADPYPDFVTSQSNESGWDFEKWTAGENCLPGVMTSCGFAAQVTSNLCHSGSSDKERLEDWLHQLRLEFYRAQAADDHQVGVEFSSEASCPGDAD
jgi:hypothetical protein